MKSLLGVVSLLCLLSTPAWAGESEPFDPDLPFGPALHRQILNGLFNQALEALSNHLEFSTSVALDSSTGERTRRFLFKFYPDGKSGMDDPIVAEGWLGPSVDQRRQEFHLRFILPKPVEARTEDRLDNVI